MRFRQSDCVDTPHGNYAVWRYMAHAKLEALLRNSELFFANATRLTDEHEVTVPGSVLESKRKELANAGLHGRELEDELAVFHWETNPMKDLVLVNCWSLSRHESYALWKIYLDAKQDGVAVRSTVSLLRRAIESGKDPYPEEFYIGKVRYRSHLRPEELSRLHIVTTKKPFYDFENEVRLFILNHPRSEGGTNPPYDLRTGRTVNIDLPTMITHVYISPFSSDSYSREVGNLLKGAGLRPDLVRQSEIRDR